MASLPGLPRTLPVSAPKILWAGKPLCPNLDGGSHYLDGINPPSTQPVTHQAEQAPGYRPKCWQFGDTMC